MVGEGVSQVARSHTKSSGLYRKIHAKTGADQGLRDASLRTTSTADFFFFYKHLGYSKVIEDLEEEEKRRRRGFENKKSIKKLIRGRPREGSPFYRLGIRTFQERMPWINAKASFWHPKKF